MLGWEYRIDFTEYLSETELNMAFETQLVSKSQFQIAYKSFLQSLRILWSLF